MSLGKRLSSFLLLGSSLGRNIAVSGCLLILAVILLNLWSLNTSWQQTISSAEESAVNLALSQARQAEDTFLQTEISLREIQRTIQQQMPGKVDTEALSRIMREQRSHLPQLHGLFYYDASGKWQAWSIGQTPAEANNSDREYFAYHRQNGHNNIHIGPAIYSRSTGELVIPVSLRLNDVAGGFAGVLLATVRVDYFRQFYAYYELGEKDVLVLMLDDSTVLYARPMPDSYVGKDLSSSRLFQEMLVKSDRGSGQWNAALDGHTRIFGFVRSARYPLVVAAGYDKPSLLQNWLKEKIQDIALNLLLLVIILAIGLTVLRQVRINVKNQTELTHLRDELTVINRMLQAMALIDGLTGLANRRQFDIYLRESVKQASASGQPLSLVMMDIDFFKRYNDAYGHVEGDKCLENVSAALRLMPLRENALIARYGGEEFAIILPETTAEEALNIARRAVEEVHHRRMPHCETDIPERVVTLSAGCATLSGSGNALDVQTLKYQADAALYEAKHKGRNQAAGSGVA
ncbi:sensor domain-containing diguanylate cyclase [Pantoea sp. FN060301]|uniref:sensor domain-containing diguanylate cyclase n=1 Tax=Pantoea sp. FN060301 TaxID=3420380 RepID=UPI003D166D91